MDFCSVWLDYRTVKVHFPIDLFVVSIFEGGRPLCTLLFNYYHTIVQFEGFVVRCKCTC